MALPPKTVEERISELEESAEGLLSTNLTLLKMVTDMHTDFLNEFVKLREEIASLKKRI